MSSVTYTLTAFDNDTEREVGFQLLSGLVVYLSHKYVAKPQS